MSYSSGDISVSSIGTDAGISDLNVASIPENIRNGDQSAKKAYVEGLAFEKVLVSELTQQMASSMSGDTGVGGSSSSGYSYSSDSSSYSSSDSSSYSGSSTSGFSSLIPEALANSIMNSGGLGIADQLAQSIDPSLVTSAASTAATTPSSTTTDATATTTTISTNGAAAAGDSSTGTQS